MRRLEITTGQGLATHMILVGEMNVTQWELNWILLQHSNVINHSNKKP